MLLLKKVEASKVNHTHARVLFMWYVNQRLISNQGAKGSPEFFDVQSGVKTTTTPTKQTTKLWNLKRFSTVSPDEKADSG